MPWTVVTHDQFEQRLVEVLQPLHGLFVAVTGPGRSGALAAVYASHYLKIPYVVPKNTAMLERSLGKLLIIDTALYTGKTLRRLSNWYSNRGIANEYRFLFQETRGNLLKFFYEDV